MANEVAVANQNTQVAFPANLAALFGGKSNLAPVDNTPSLTFKGKVFTVNVKGQHKQLLDEEENPLPMVDVIVLGANRYRSRTYYPGGYTEGSTASPTCHSFDGKRPANDVEEPQSTSCETCEHAVKGSKVTESGAATTACSLRQRLVVIPSDKPDFTGLLLNLASTSTFDKEEPDAAKGWFSWTGYTKNLQARGVPHTAGVITRIRFSAAEAYPKLQFKFAGIIDESIAETVAGRIESDEVLSLLNKDYKSEPKQIEVKPVADKAVQAETDDTPTPAPKAEAKPKPVAKPKPAPVVEEEAEEATAPKPAPKAEKAKPVVVEEGDDISSVLSSWD